MTPEPEWVDLGLPSGLLWRRFNLGATPSEPDGLYFSWGNTEGHSVSSGYDFSVDVYAATPAAAIDEDIPLSQDAARESLGAPWRMPTAAEFQELFDNCNSAWVKFYGVNGRLFTSRLNGRMLFFPAAGFYIETALQNHGLVGRYWSSSYDSETNAFDMGFTDSEAVPQRSAGRHVGFSIRAVRSASF